MTAPENLYTLDEGREPGIRSRRSIGFQEFTEFLNFAQDKLVVRLDADEEKGLTVFLGAEFYPPAPPPKQEQEIFSEYDEKQPIVAGQPTIFEPDPPQPPPPPPAKRPRAPRKRTAAQGNTDRPPDSRAGLQGKSRRLTHRCLKPSAPRTSGGS